MRVLTVNAGSSSVKAALFAGGAARRGRVSRLRGTPLLEAGEEAQALPEGTDVVIAVGIPSGTYGPDFGKGVTVFAGLDGVVRHVHLIGRRPA